MFKKGIFLFSIVLVFLVSCKKDKTEPTISINGDATITLCLGNEYEDEGATASDDVDGDLTEYIEVVNNVDASTEGTYTIVYMVTDEAGNTASKERTVTVVICK